MEGGKEMSVLKALVDKPLEFWAALIGMIVYVAIRDAEQEPFWKRGAKTFASALLTLGLAPTTAVYLRNSEVLAAVLLMAFGMLVLDTLTSIGSNTEFIKDVIKLWIGRGGK